MNFSFNIFQILILLGAINGFVWSFLIVLKRGKAGVNNFLGLFILVFALGSIKIVLQEKIPLFNSFLPLPLLYQFTFGPLLYLYLKKLFNPSSRFSTQTLWHFLPSLLFDVLPAFIVFCFNSHSALVEKLSFLLDILAFLFFAVYWYLSILLIGRYKNMVETVKTKALNKWTNKVIAASAITVLTWLIYLLWVIVLKGKWIFGMLPYYPVYLVLSCCIYGLGIAGYHRPEIGLLDVAPNEKKILIPFYELQAQKERVLTAVKQHQYYLDENLNLATLANHLQIPVKEFSYILNTGFQMNFNDFINELRVSEFKLRLIDPKNEKYSLLGLAYDVGFSSKASFYRAFKKATNQTPAEYQKANSDVTKK